jgi:hypothetical protein
MFSTSPIAVTVSKNVSKGVGTVLGRVVTVLGLIHLQNWS